MWQLPVQVQAVVFVGPVVWHRPEVLVVALVAVLGLGLPVGPVGLGPVGLVLSAPRPLVTTGPGRAAVASRNRSDRFGQRYVTIPFALPFARSPGATPPTLARWALDA